MLPWRSLAADSGRSLLSSDTELPQLGVESVLDEGGRPHLLDLGIYFIYRVLLWQQLSLGEGKPGKTHEVLDEEPLHEGVAKAVVLRAKLSDMKECFSQLELRCAMLEYVASVLLLRFRWMPFFSSWQPFSFCKT